LFGYVPVETGTWYTPGYNELPERHNEPRGKTGVLDEGDFPHNIY